MPAVRIQCTTLDDISWQPLTSSLPVEPLVIYRAFIPAFGAAVPFFKSLMTPDEQQRAGRYHQAKDRQRFFVSRGTLRVLVGMYTGQHPDTVKFAPGTNKKPVVMGFSDLHYNVSHAGDWVLIAIGSVPVGVDVERIDPAFEYQSILRDSFSETEQQYIRKNDNCRSAFYRLWTRKEALTKATAKGIDDTFFRVPSLDGVHRVADDLMQTTENWMVGSFGAADDYAAAVAYPDDKFPNTPAFYSVEPGGLIIV